MLPARSRYVSGYADGSSDAPLDLDSLELTEKNVFSFMLLRCGPRQQTFKMTASFEVTVQCWAVVLITRVLLKLVIARLHDHAMVPEVHFTKPFLSK